MALQYSTGSMFLGNSTSTNEQSSLIGNTKFTHASALTGTLAISKASAADVKLTTEIHLLSTEGDITIDPNSQQLTTEITPAVLFATAPDDFSKNFISALVTFNILLRPLTLEFIPSKFSTITTSPPLSAGSNPH